MPADVRARVVDDLRHGLKLSSFVPHVTVEDKEVTGSQTLEFTAGFQVDGKSFDPTRIDRTLKLHDVDEWTLSSATGSHPFHIHVNPFQVVKILDPSGKDVSAPDAVDDYGGVSPDPEYPGLKGVWKDTLWVKSAADQKKYTIVVRTRYERYIGDFVLHCHILDHEDQGMMQMVRVALPDGAGGIATGHSH
jgi:L-ascorbate oxidase